jgi:hypothetical protein
MTADELLYAVRLTEWEVGRCTTMHLRSLAADAEPLYRSPTVGRIAIQRQSVKKPHIDFFEANFILITIQIQVIIY